MEQTFFRLGNALCRHVVVLVEVFHRSFVLLLVEPGLVGLEQSYDLPRVQVLLVLTLTYQELKNLLELQLGHVQGIIIDLINTSDHAMQFRQNLSHCLSIGSAVSRILAEQSN